MIVLLILSLLLSEPVLILFEGEHGVVHLDPVLHRYVSILEWTRGTCQYFGMAKGDFRIFWNGPGGKEDI